MRNYMKLTAGILALVLAFGVLLTGCKKETEVIPYDYDLSEYITLPQYKGVEVEKYTGTVTDEDVQRQVTLARTSFAVQTEKEGAAQNGDTVNIDFIGYINGEVFASGSGSNQDLTLGSGMFIDGFESGLVGAKAGDQVTLNLAFPDPYVANPSLSGVPVTFEVTVNKVTEQVLPEYNDAFVKEKYNYDSAEAFEKAIREALVKQNEMAHNNHISEQVWKNVMQNTALKQFPEKEYNALYDEAIAYYTNMATSAQKSLNEYVLENFKITIGEFRETIENSVKESVLQEMIVYAVARQENLTVTEEEYNIRGTETAVYYGLASVKELENYFTKDEIKKSILFDMVTELFVGNAVEKG